MERSDVKLLKVSVTEKSSELLKVMDEEGKTYTLMSQQPTHGLHLENGESVYLQISNPKSKIKRFLNYIGRIAVLESEDGNSRSIIGIEKISN
jgi:hypothetical protein